MRTMQVLKQNEFLVKITFLETTDLSDVSLPNSFNGLVAEVMSDSIKVIAASDSEQDSEKDFDMLKNRNDIKAEKI